MTRISNGLKVVIEGVRSTNQRDHAEYTVQFDGKQYPVKSMRDGKPREDLATTTISAKRIDDYTVEFTQNSNGKVVGHTKVLVSKDGKMHTATQTGMTPQGQSLNNTIVAEKQ